MKMHSAFYQAQEQDLEKFIADAADHYASIHTHLPECVVVDFWRRVTELHPDKWNVFYYGVIPIKVYSPLDSDLPEHMLGIQIRADVALCFGVNQ
jgi:hypothetical protein